MQKGGKDIDGRKHIMTEGQRNREKGIPGSYQKVPVVVGTRNIQVTACSLATETKEG
jgi:hypothetical protein